ncbi:MAG: efflux RND transporter permease subunit [Prolixibacteraceae bacterium]|jgi:multidrug efflux pump subunit AcrB/ABC-type multidrug transport system ATPase subunit|nr:efflux RND transporter permease subunit [Prolixibacteraceae bacterium]
MDFIIRRRTLISMVFLAMVMLGVISYNKLSMELYPTPEMPVMVVMVNSSIEVDPEYMESQAIIPLEGAIGQLEGVEEISSMATRRNGTIEITYNEGTNLKYAQLRLQEKMNETKSKLPEEFFVVVDKVDLRAMLNQFMSIQILGEGGVDRLRNVADQEIQDPLMNVDGIASVNIYGGREKSIEIEIAPEVAEAYNLSPARIRQMLQSGYKERTYVGEVFESTNRYFVNVSSEFKAISDIGNVIVDQSSGLKLKDVATITFGTKEETSYSRVNGKDVISMVLINDNSANLIELSHRAREAIDELNDKLESMGVEIIIQNDSAETMEKNIDQIIELAIIGGLLAIVILWYFLRNIRLVTTVAMSIPISVYAAFNFFYAFDITINSITLVGMALAIGMLIDNSVVVLENIYRLAGRGMSLRDSVIQGTREVWRSILAATLTTICVFVPFFFTDDMIVKLFGRQIGVSIVATLFISFLVAILLIPMITYLILGHQTKQKKIAIFEKVSIRQRIVQIYILVLKTCMRNPITTIISGLVVFFATLLISLATQTQKLEEVENNQIDIYITMDSGATLEKTDELVSALEKDLMEIEEKKNISSKIEEESAVVTVILQDDFEKIANQDFDDIRNKIEHIMDDHDHNAEIDFEQSASSEQFGTGGGGMHQNDRMQRMMGIGSKEERVEIKGQDYEMMKKVADDLEYYLEDLDEINRVRSNLASNRPEVHLNFDKESTGRNNVTMVNVMQELTSFKKEVASGFNFKHEDDEYEIIIRTDTVTELSPMRMSDLEKLEIQNAEGGNYELQDLSRIYYNSGISRISRLNQEKVIELTYQFGTEINNDKDLLESARAEVDELIASLPIPSGIALQVVHEEDDYAAYYPLIAMAFFLIFMILASVFESFATPFVMMFSIPLAAIGSLLMLIFTGNSLLSANTLTGFIILLGVVVNNGIILIDYSNILRKQGYRTHRALLMAGLARLRPILITAITTIIAMLPLAMGKSEYVGIIGAPFALTVIGGLAFSTILTLVFIPTFYSGLNNALAWFRELPLWLRLLQYFFFIGGGLLIYLDVNKFIWQLICLILLIIIVPAIVWFVLNSLRKANETIIPENEPIVIRIQNLVKIYDRPGRFKRNWISGIRIRGRFNNANSYSSISDLSELSWKVPLIGFISFMAFSYLSIGIWVFIALCFIYFMLLDVVNILSIWFTNRGKGARTARLVKNIWHWISPLAALAYLYLEFETIGLIIVILVIIYLALLIDFVSRKIQREKINVNRLKGKNREFRRVLYQFVLSIPIIGKRSVPFKALQGVSLEIGKGMYGLLGPNGAGKSTLMRAICGINTQSYGKVWFNSIDADLKREELQGLIGYLPQDFGMYENMTAWDYLQYQAMLKKISHSETRDARVQSVLESVHMWDNKNKKIGSFSGGMKQRIGIAQVLLHLPRILVVDEPTAGLDPRERIRFRNLLVELSRERIVIFSTHIIEDIASSCNQLAVLRKGAVQYVGSPRNMTDAAKGHVWQVDVPETEFEFYTKKYNVAHHHKIDDRIKLRIVSKDKPHENAEAVIPNLEDAYLWLQKG